MKEVLFNIVQSHNYLLESIKVNSGIKNELKMFYTKSGNLTNMEYFLEKMTTALFRHFGKKVIVLIDEFDKPLMHALTARLEGTFTDGELTIIREFFIAFVGCISKGTTDNEWLDRIILTGVTGIVQGSRSSQMNNFTVNSIVNIELNDYFGFSLDEIDTLIQMVCPQNASGINEQKRNIKDWYNGYTVISGATPLTVYDPWSITNYLRDCISSGYIPTRPLSYWTNSDLMEVPIWIDILERSKVNNNESENAFYTLITNQIDARQILIEHSRVHKMNLKILFVYLLVHCGYLTFDNIENTLRIPNNSVKEYLTREILKSKLGGVKIENVW